MEQDFSSTSAQARIQCNDSVTQAASTSSPQTMDMVNLQICPSTGGQFEISLSRDDSIDVLKRAISKKVKIPKEKFNILQKDRALNTGSLRDNNICDGSSLMLVPQVEAGLVSQRPDQTVMQALENLSDNQVNDFLSGKSPLTLAMRLGDHMMFVQLQLSTPASKRHKRKSSKKSSSRDSTLSSSSHSSPVPSSSSKQKETLHTVQNEAGQRQSSAAPYSIRPSTSSMTSSTSSMTSSMIPPVADIHLPTLDSAALSEATRNLSKKLKELSKMSAAATVQKEVVPDKTSSSPSAATNKKNSGAIIESMQHHGQGVYSGTFSGTLNPALQDTEGKPKKSLSTIIHILNDLLGAQPQYRAQVSKPKKLKEVIALRRQERPSSTSSQSEAETMDCTTDESKNLENKSTKTKIEQLKMIMKEKQIKRKQRRESRAPYSWHRRKSSDGNVSNSSFDDSSMEVDANVEVADGSPENQYNSLPQETVIV